MKHINAEFTVPKTNTIQKFKKVISPESLIPDENEIFTWTSVENNCIYENYWIGGEDQPRKYELGPTATQEEVNLGTNNDRYVTPKTQRTYVESLLTGGGILPGFKAKADENVEVNSLVTAYYNEDDQAFYVKLANALSIENACDGIVIGITDNIAMVYTYAQVMMDCYELGNNVPVYLGLNGGFTATPPSESNQIVQKLGHTIGTNGILFSYSEPRIII